MVDYYNKNFLHVSTVKHCEFQSNVQLSFLQTPETSSGSCVSATSLQQKVPFHLARIALDDSMKDDTGTANYKCVKVC